MFLTMLKAKIHRVRVTHADLHYEGSCSIDTELLAASGILPNEHIHVWNITRGSRLETYALPAAAGSGIIQMNGAAAHHAKKGDLIIITSFALVPAKDAKKHKPRIVFVDAKNGIKEIARKSGRIDKLPIK